jgi:hypothetical protein
MNATELIGSGEVAELLGVSPGRVRQLVTTRADFPDPTITHRSASGTPRLRLWQRADIERWRDEANRRPGPHGAAA